jgi:hypothetical protein
MEVALTDDTSANLTQRLEEIIHQTSQFGAQCGE